MRREDDPRAVLTGALFAAVFVIVLVGLGRASHVISGPGAPLPAVSRMLEQ
jgi:hypothetical protein